MEDNLEGQNAIDGLNNTVVDNLMLTVEVAKVKQEHKGSYKIGNGPIEVYRFNRRK